MQKQTKQKLMIVRTAASCPELHLHPFPACSLPTLFVGYMELSSWPFLFDIPVTFLWHWWHPKIRSIKVS